MKTPSLFNPEDLPPRIRYEKLFKHLPPLEETSKQRGRPAFSKNAILRALIYRNLRGLPSLADLAFELENNPMMAEVLGFLAFQHPPSKERFSCFLRTTPNRDLQRIRLGLVRALKDEKVISVPDDGGGRFLPQQGIIHQETGQAHGYDLVSLKEQEEPVLGGANQGRKCQPKLPLGRDGWKRQGTLVERSSG